MEVLFLCLLLRTVRYQQESQSYRVRSSDTDNGLSSHCSQASGWACREFWSLFPSLEQLLVPCASQSNDQRQIKGPGWSLVPWFLWGAHLQWRQGNKHGFCLCWHSLRFRAGYMHVGVWICVHSRVGTPCRHEALSAQYFWSTGACSVEQVKFLNQILLLILLFTRSDRFLLHLD